MHVLCDRASLVTSRFKKHFLMNQNLIVVPHQEDSTTTNPIVSQQQQFIKQLQILSAELLLAIPILILVALLGSLAELFLVRRYFRHAELFITICPNLTGLLERLE